MRQVLVHYNMQNADTEMFLIESGQDFKDLIDTLNKATIRVATKIIRSNAPFDHMGGNFKGLESGIFAMAYAKSQSNSLRETGYTNPLYLVDEAAQRYATSIAKALARGHQVLLNKSGGWCTPCKEVEIVKDLGEIEFSFDQKILICSKTKYLVIENDVSLERKAKQYLSTVDCGYSFITELRLLSDERLTELFKQFIANGGQVLYVYTTGSDVLQAETYTDLAFKAGIRKFEFQFSVEKPDAFQGVIANLKRRKASVKEIV